MSALSGVLDFLFPPKCVFCHRVLKVGERGCCGKCRQSLLGTCPPRAGVHFTQCYAPLAYEGSVREAMIRFKFHDRPGFATEFGRILAECVRENLAGRSHYMGSGERPAASEARLRSGYAAGNGSGAGAG